MDIDKIKSFFSRPWVDVAIRIFVLLSVLTSLSFQYQVSHLSYCLRSYIQANATASEAAKKAADEDRKVIDDLVIATTNAKSSADVRKALAEYEAARDRNDVFRKAHPAPSPVNICK